MHAELRPWGGAIRSCAHGESSASQLRMISELWASSWVAASSCQALSAPGILSWAIHVRSCSGLVVSCGAEEILVLLGLEGELSAAVLMVGHDAL